MNQPETKAVQEEDDENHGSEICSTLRKKEGCKHFESTIQSDSPQQESGRQIQGAQQWKFDNMVD